MTHEIKTIQPFYNLIQSGEKTFEVRKNDRNYQVGDIVILQEFDHIKKEYSGREITIKITYILESINGIEDDYCVFGFTKVSLPDAPEQTPQIEWLKGVQYADKAWQGKIATIIDTGTDWDTVRMKLREMLFNSIDNVSERSEYDQQKTAFLDMAKQTMAGKVAEEQFAEELKRRFDVLFNATYSTIRHNQLNNVKSELLNPTKP